jgi:DNA repair protein RadD
MQLRWYQSEASYSFYHYVTNGGRGHPLIAMPTGTGKSLVIADILQNLFKLWPHIRVMMLTHVKELIEQNAEELLKLWSTAPLGIYSAGLKQRDSILPIVFGGIQSVAKKIELFGWRDLIFIDEAHLLSDKETSLYQSVIKALCLVNPNLMVVGLTATPFRMRMGRLTEGGLFTEIIYDITSYDSFNRLIAEGFISPLIPKKTATELDVSSVGMTAGELNKKQLEAAVDKDEITFAAVKETVEQGQDRRSWLTFASGIAHAEHIASMYQSFGVQAAAVHSELSDEENARRIRDFKNGYLRCMVGNNKFTTGFNHPPVDLISMLRPTLSPGLWVQMLGRGTRPSPDTGKENCLVLDFAANTRRLGPINDPKIPGKPGKGGGDVPVRICDCGAYNHAAARFCCACGAEFIFATKLFKSASEEQLLRSDAPVVEIFPVNRVIYNRHEKKNGEGHASSPPSIKVSYFCGLQMFNEWVCLEHSGLAGKRARDWWRQRHQEEPPTTTYDALQRTQELRVPARIRVWINKKYPEILGYEY